MSGAPATIAVVSWNTRTLLERCLRSLEADQRSGRAEVWVVDNGSGDGSPETVRSEFPWAHLLVPGANLGFGRAVNLVAERAGGDWIAAANADTEVTPGALGALLDAGAADPQAGAVAPKLILPDGSVQDSVRGFPSLGRSVLYHLRTKRLAPRFAERHQIGGSWDPEQPRRVEWATGAFILIRRRAFEEVGGFAADQWMYAEDLDLCWRLDRSGWAVRYEPTAVVRHHHSAAASAAFGGVDGVAERWMRATYAWMIRRRGPAFAKAHAGLDLADAAARFAVLAPLARISPRRWSARRDRARASMRLFRIGFCRQDRLIQEAHRPPDRGDPGI